MSFASIDKPSKYFNTSLWTGNDSTQSLSSFGFSPDLVWIKTRTGTQYHGLFDTIRGALVSLQSNTTTGDQTFSNSLTSFDSDGFTLGSNDNFNWSTKTYVGWSWRGSDSSAVSNTSGTISSTVSANTTAGFSIVSYTANQASTATIGHGLGVAPSMIIVKERSGTADWMVYHKSVGNDGNLKLNTTNAKLTGITWRSTSPTSTVFTVGEDGGDYQVNYPSGATYIAYCFAEVKGFSKFGSYTGNGSSDGTFIYTGFKPAWVMVKCSSNPDEDWIIFDNKRNDFNGLTKRIMANLNNSEGTDSAEFDFVSNGFKCRYASSNRSNASGRTYIYMAFSESPFVSSKAIPTTAR